MSITDELRYCIRTANRSYEDVRNPYNNREVLHIPEEELLKIADRIDREHERMWRELTIDAEPMTDESMAEHGLVKLPVDADGVPIHVGDEVAFLGRMTVDATDGHNVFFFADNWADGVYCVRADELRHYHAPTVEDVLLDACKAYHGLMVESMSDMAHDMPAPSEIIAEYAAKLRLAGDE